MPTPPGWERLPAAYLAFGDTYADERAEAVRRGWPVETLPGLHLHQLVGSRPRSAERWRRLLGAIRGCERIPVDCASAQRGSVSWRPAAARHTP